MAFAMPCDSLTPTGTCRECLLSVAGAAEEDIGLFLQQTFPDIRAFYMEKGPDSEVVLTILKVRISLIDFSCTRLKYGNIFNQ